jgi:hypothetical protein
MSATQRRIAIPERTLATLGTTHPLTVAAFEAMGASKQLEAIIALDGRWSAL